MSPGSKRKGGIAMAIMLIAALVASFSRREAAHPPPAAEKPRADKQGKAPANAAFDFYLMAMTVHSAFCADNARRRECAIGNPRPLVIHGLWPERMEPRTYPHDCPAPALDLDPALSLELADMMPAWLTDCISTSGERMVAAADSMTTTIIVMRSS
jgi:ribonuclease I